MKRKELMGMLDDNVLFLFFVNWWLSARPRLGQGLEPTTLRTGGEQSTTRPSFIVSA